MILLFLSNFRLVQVHKFLFSYRYSQFLDFITFLQNKDIRYSFKQRLHIEDTARLGQAVARWVFFQGISQAKESCESFMGDSIEKCLPMEKWERVMRRNVQDFPLDIRGLAKVVAPLISYCHERASWHYRTVYRLNPVKSKWTAGTYFVFLLQSLLESYSNRSRMLTKDWMLNSWIGVSQLFHICKGVQWNSIETFYWKIFKISWDIAIWNSCSKNW